MAANPARLRPAAPMRAPGRPKAAEGLDTREALLRAGRSLFATKGFAGVAVSEIAEAAGISVPMIYQRFGSKAGLFVAVAEDVYTSALEHMESAMDGVDKFEDAVDLVLESFASMYRIDRQVPTMVLTVLVEVNREEALAQELQPTLRSFRAFFDKIADLAPPALAADQRSRRDLSRALVTMCSGLTAAAVTIPRATDYERMVEVIRHITRVHPVEADS